MAATDPRHPSRRTALTRRDFVKRTGLGSAAALAVGARWSPAQAAAASYPDWIAASTKPAKRGGTLTRASRTSRVAPGSMLPKLPCVTEPKLT